MLNERLRISLKPGKQGPMRDFFKRWLAWCKIAKEKRIKDGVPVSPVGIIGGVKVADDGTAEIVFITLTTEQLRKYQALTRELGLMEGVD